MITLIIFKGGHYYVKQKEIRKEHHKETEENVSRCKNES